MMKMTFRMSRQPRGGAGKRTRKGEEIKEPALVRQRRGLLLKQDVHPHPAWALMCLFRELVKFSVSNKENF
jgi:hypothetical protein